MKLYHELQLLICVILVSNFVKTATSETKIFKNGKRIIGVSSVAGVASRNGRFSSIGGVRFYQEPDGPYQGAATPFRYYPPITVAHASDGRAASASVHYFPNSVIASSSTGTGSNPQINSWIPKVPTIPNMFQSPEEIFDHARSFHPWMPKELFKYFYPSNMKPKEAWSYPSYNPFDSYWR